MKKEQSKVCKEAENGRMLVVYNLQDDFSKYFNGNLYVLIRVHRYLVSQRNYVEVQSQPNLYLNLFHIEDN